MLFELGVTLADSLTVHPEAIPTTLARRRRPRLAAYKNQAATGLYRRWEPRGEGLRPFLSAAPARPETAHRTGCFASKSPTDG
jgi:hypothetical protein